MRQLVLLAALGGVLVAGCEYNAANPSVAAKPAVFNSEGRPTVEIKLPDMMCEDGCALTVRDILVRQPGAKEVKVDFDSKLATVAIDEGEFDRERAIADLVDKGFDKSTLVHGETDLSQTANDETIESDADVSQTPEAQPPVTETDASHGSEIKAADGAAAG